MLDFQFFNWSYNKVIKPYVDFKSQSSKTLLSKQNKPTYRRKRRLSKQKNTDSARNYEVFPTAKQQKQYTFFWNNTKLLQFNKVGQENRNEKYPTLPDLQFSSEYSNTVKPRFALPQISTSDIEFDFEPTSTSSISIDTNRATNLNINDLTNVKSNADKIPTIRLKEIYQAI